GLVRADEQNGVGIYDVSLEAVCRRNGVAGRDLVGVVGAAVGIDGQRPLDSRVGVRGDTVEGERSAIQDAGDVVRGAACQDVLPDVILHACGAHSTPTEGIVAG